MTNEQQHPQPVYFKSLTIQGVNCFKSEQTIDLSNGKGEPAMWTVILGNNNTGKTTVLRCLAGMKIFIDTRPKVGGIHDSSEVKINKSKEFRKNFFSYKTDTLSNLKFKIKAVLSNKDVPSFEMNSSGNKEKSNIVLAYSKHDFLIDAYGTQRKQGKGSYIEYKLEDRTESLFKDDYHLFVNAEEWFLGMMFNVLEGDKKSQNNLDRIKRALIDFLPDIADIEIGGNGTRRVHFISKGGDKVLIHQLGSGYQSLITWVVDFAKRMFDRYPESANPLAEPAIVLVDEIDLHLHPEWQRKIVAFLREKFPKTQFIVTAHSPLVIQSADDINVVVLQKNETTDDVEVYQPEITNFQGWTVEEILSDLMRMGDKIYSNEYLKWIKQFDAALDSDNYELAKEAYDSLEKMVHSSATLKMLRMQMSSLMPKSHD